MKIICYTKEGPVKIELTPQQEQLLKSPLELRLEKTEVRLDKLEGRV